MEGTFQARLKLESEEQPELDNEEKVCGGINDPGYSKQRTGLEKEAQSRTFVYVERSAVKFKNSYVCHCVSRPTEGKCQILTDGKQRRHRSKVRTIPQYFHRTGTICRAGAQRSALSTQRRRGLGGPQAMFSSSIISA